MRLTFGIEVRERDLTDLKTLVYAGTSFETLSGCAAENVQSVRQHAIFVFMLSLLFGAKACRRSNESKMRTCIPTVRSLICMYVCIYIYIHI